MKPIGSLLIVLLFGLSSSRQAQQNSASYQNWQKEDDEPIQKEYLFDVYIPEDMGDAFLQLNKLIDASSKAKFKAAPEEEAVHKLHFSLGRWIIYNWQFYEGSRLSHSLKQLNIHHPDDMARVLIRSYHRYLNKRPLDVKAQVEAIEERKQKEREERMKARIDSSLVKGKN
jgi:hypothetical protein